MPRPTMPPSPLLSSDILPTDAQSAKESPNFNRYLSSLEISFSLPPPALGDPGHFTSSSVLRVAPPKPDFRPISPATSPVKNFLQVQQPSSGRGTKRRRSSATNNGQSSPVVLPPPPTRSRKIIQMKPPSSTQTSPVTKPTNSSTSPSSPEITPANKKKQPSATSAAGRKIARKTAHSLIERRRRSKMNEEFALLKSMIPACKEAEMHKLAILQAGIEYVRYLERCIDELQGASRGEEIDRRRMFIGSSGSSRKRSLESVEDEDEEAIEEEESEEDVAQVSYPTTAASSLAPSVNATPMLSAQKQMENLVEAEEATQALLLLADRRGSKALTVKEMLVS